MRTRGFTIVELIITITIMGILLTLAAVTLSSTQVKARDDERRTDIEAIQTNLESLYASGVPSNDSTPTITNLIPNPAANVNTTGWAVSSGGGSSSSISREIVGGPAGVTNTFYRRTITASPTSSPLSITPTVGTGTSALPITPNTTYTISGYMRTSVNLSAHVRIDATPYNAAGTSLGSLATGTTFSQTPNTWQRISRTVTTAADAAFIRFSFVFSGPTGAPVGSTFDVTGVMIAQGDTMYDYADGNASGWVWSGAIGGSSSAGPSVPPGKPGVYPGILLAREDFLELYLSDTDLKIFTAPGQPDASATFVAATNNVQTADGVLPQPTINQYVYQPIDTSGALCSDLACRKYNLYYRTEENDTVHMVTSKNQ